MQVFRFTPIYPITRRRDFAFISPISKTSHVERQHQLVLQHRLGRGGRYFMYRLRKMKANDYATARLGVHLHRTKMATVLGGGQPITGVQPLIEFQFVPIQSQSSIFGAIAVLERNDTNLLIATSRHGVLRLECKDGTRAVLSTVPFTYLPAGAEVVALDAYLEPPNGMVVGVALMKESDDEKVAFLNVYGLHLNPETAEVQKLLTEDWLSLSLKFLPIILTHSCILVNGHIENVFLVSGTDRRIHLYRKVLDGEESTLREEECALYFPELVNIPSCATALSFKRQGHTRFTAIGCQDGFLQCAIVDMESANVLKCWRSEKYSGTLTVVQLFTLNTEAGCGRNHGWYSQPTLDAGGLSHHFPMHLLICSSLSTAIVHSNVKENGLSTIHALPKATEYDTILCAEVADVDWDGKNELILGTFGKVILIFKAVEGANADCKSQIALEFFLLAKYQIAFSVHGLKYADVSGDGFKELVALSVRGIHLFQHRLQEGLKLCIHRLQEQ